MVWQVSGDRLYIVILYVDGLQVKVQCVYMNIEGYWWFDCVEVFSEFLQCVCLGGIVLKCNQSWFGYIVSWCFDCEGVVEQVVLLVYVLLCECFIVISYNLGMCIIGVDMIGWNVVSGIWWICSGVDVDGDGYIDGMFVECCVQLEISVLVVLQFCFGCIEVFEFECVFEGILVEIWLDLGVGCGDVCIDGSQLQVIVYSLGYVGIGMGVVMLEDVCGCEIVCMDVLVLGVFSDLQLKIVQVWLLLLVGDCSGLCVCVVLVDGGEEVIWFNNVVGVL